jgi:hypothetical protein
MSRDMISRHMKKICFHPLPFYGRDDEYKVGTGRDQSNAYPGVPIIIECVGIPLYERRSRLSVVADLDVR